MSIKNAAALFGIIILAACQNPTGPGSNSGTKSLTGITVTTLPTKVRYNLNETFDPAGMVVTATYSDGSAGAVTGYETSGFSSAAAGNKTITVTYQGKEATFTITVIDPGKETVAKPAANPAAGAVVSGTTVTLTTSTTGAEIWYTTNGSAPAKNGMGSAKYATPITITAAVTLKAIAIKDGMNDSAVLEAAYTIQATPIVVAVTGVTLNKSATTLTVGATEVLTATVTPSNAANKNITWSSSNTGVATVSNGTVTAVAEGTATITVTTTDGNKTATCAVTVDPAAVTTVAVTGVTLNKSATTLTVGATEVLTATIAPSNATNKNITWSSGNTAVATVSNGTITAVAEGTATITVTTTDGNKTATCAVTVDPVVTTVAVTGVTLNKSATTLTVGATEVLTATVAPSDATNKAVTWSSGNTAVATVSNGTITAVAPGTATITVTTTDGNKSATCAVTVDPVVVAVTGVTLNKTSVTLTVGATETLTATVTPSDAANQTVTWSSGNTAVATVNNGTITALTTGTATITVTTADGNKTATCAVTVNPVAVTGVTLNKSATTLTVGDTEVLTATVTPSDAANQTVTWSSGNTAVATVNNGTITALTTGTATITVTTADGNKTATCAVTVNPVAVTGVTLNKSATTLTVGATEVLTATITPSDATNKAVTWTSSDTAVATVSNGTITACTAGTAIIIVATADGGKTATCAVTVNKADETFSITFTADAAPLIDGPTIYRSSANGPTTATLTVTNPGQYSSIDWYINEITTGSGASFTLNAADVVYNRIGEHTLTVEVIKDGIPYSRAITFTVAE